MIKKKIIFALGALLFAPITTYAEKIQFINGDSLDALIIRQTNTTLTFSHAVLGEITVDKAKIGNLSTLNLEDMNKENTAFMPPVAVPQEETVTESVPAEQAEVEKEVKIAQEKAIVARENVDKAKAALQLAQKNMQVAEIEDKELAQQAVLDAEAKLKATQQALIVAVDDIGTIKKNAVIAEKVGIANVAVAVADKKLKQVMDDLKQAEANLRQAKKQLRYAKEAGADDDVLAAAADKVDMAEEAVDTVNEKIELATEKMELAQEKVQLAKGEKVPNGFLGTGWFKGWDSSFEVGISGASGSTNNAKFRMGFNSLFENDEHRWDFKTYFFYNSEDNAVTEQRLNAVLVKDWFFKNTPWFAFMSATYDMDEFRDWDHRLQIAIGPGYQFIKNDDWELSGRMAGTGIFEFGKKIDDPNNPADFDENIPSTYLKTNTQSFELMLGADLAWQISPKQKFTFSNYIYPSMTDLSEFRNVTKINWMHDVEFFEGLAITFGIINEYDSTETNGNDLRYSMSAMFHF